MQVTVEDGFVDGEVVDVANEGLCAARLSRLPLTQHLLPYQSPLPHPLPPRTVLINRLLRLRNTLACRALQICLATSIQGNFASLDDLTIDAVSSLLSVVSETSLAHDVAIVNSPAALPALLQCPSACREPRHAVAASRRCPLLVQFQELDGVGDGALRLQRHRPRRRRHAARHHPRGAQIERGQRTFIIIVVVVVIDRASTMRIKI